MGIAFDDGVADALIGAAESADRALRLEGGFLDSALDQAMEHFSGGYARLFAAACVARSEDRGRLGGILAALADDVRSAKLKAREEKDRQEELAAWQRREEVREQQRRAAPFGVLLEFDGLLFDVKPSDIAIAAPTISAPFSVRGRPRFAGNSSDGTTSAEPGRLRAFAGQSRAANNILSAEFGRIRAAWSAFVDLCSWAPIDQATVVFGFERLIAENASDADWVEKIAAAFEAAGSGYLADTALNGLFLHYAEPGQISLRDIATLSSAELRAWLAVPAKRDRLGALLRAQGYDPALTAAWWSGLGQTVDPGTGKVTVGETQRLLIEAFPGIIGNLQGVAYTARDLANRLVLTRQLEEFDVFVRQSAMGAQPAPAAWLKSPGHLERLKSIRNALTSGRSGAVKQLISLNLDQPGAAISVGDLDAAKVTTYQVPGVDTTVSKSMFDLTIAADVQYSQQYQAAGDSVSRAGTPPRLAVVGWVAFEPAPAAGVYDDGNAWTGGDFLSKDIKVLAAVQDSLGNTASNNVSALSYGTLTAQAAAMEGLAVDSINLNADIGVLPGVCGVQDFHLNPGAEVYQTKFTVDQVSELGNLGRHHIQDAHVQTDQSPLGGPSFTVPVPGFGATQLGADGTAATETEMARLPTENHGWLESDGKRGYASLNTESSVNQAYASLGLTAKLTNSGKPVVHHE